VADLEPKTVQIEVKCQVGVGSQFKDMTEVVAVFKNEEATISHKAGQVMLVDFWATWCPPCQTPMAHNQTMLEKNGERWGDKVRIVGLSIDKDTETVSKHVKAKKWESVEHFFRAGSSCSDDYGVSGVPKVLLIDT
jgi:thiol-disulfide isomerase/thioredoxin